MARYDVAIIRPQELLKMVEVEARKKGEKLPREGEIGFIPKIGLTEGYTIHTLCQYRVEDRAWWNYQENIRKREEGLIFMLIETVRRQELLLDEISNFLRALNKHTKETGKLTKIMTILAYIMTVATIIMLLNQIVTLFL